MQSLVNSLSSLLFVLAIAFLGFSAGAFIILEEVFPHRHFSNAHKGGKALFDKVTRYQDPFQTDFWAPARTDRQGVTLHNQGRAFQGFTLYTSGHETAAFLVSMDGETRHEWRLPFSAVWDETAAVEHPQPDDFMYWRRAHVFPNGDLIAMFVAAGDSPWGYGLVKLDKDSNVIWKYMEQTHHDLDVAANGDVYVLGHAIRSGSFKNYPQLKSPRIDDFVAVLSPDGVEQKRVWILDALMRSPYKRLVTRVPWYTTDDFLHTNAIDVIDAEHAANLPFASEGNVLLSFREIDTIAVLDLEREEIVWALRGAWLSQHDPDIMPDGKIMLFDNLGHYTAGGQSRIMEFDPVGLGISWLYTGDEDRPFDSDVRSAQQPLPNGNVLITESTGGRIFEVTRQGEIVWEYINPVRTADPDDPARALIPVVSWAQRIDPASLTADWQAQLESD